MNTLFLLAFVFPLETSYAISDTYSEFIGVTQENLLNMFSNKTIDLILEKNADVAQAEFMFDMADLCIC